MILRKIVSVFIFICSSPKRLLDLICQRRSSHIGELPYVIDKEDRCADPNQLPFQDGPSPNTWKSWDDKSFGVESKIEEYRRQKVQSTAGSPGASDSVDFFNEMQPKFKAPKTLHLNAGAKQEVSKPRNLFEVRENDVLVPDTATAELGELDLGPSAANWGNTNSSVSWAEAVDVNPNVENLAAEQKRREREEKHRQRQSDHEQRLREKRSGSVRQAN